MHELLFWPQLWTNGHCIFLNAFLFVPQTLDGGGTDIASMADSGIVPDLSDTSSNSELMFFQLGLRLHLTNEKQKLIQLVLVRGWASEGVSVRLAGWFPSWLVVGRMVDWWGLADQLINPSAG